MTQDDANCLISPKFNYSNLSNSTIYDINFLNKTRPTKVEVEMGTSFKRGIVAVDLFCGVGGLTCGLQQAGIRVSAGIDNDETCEFAYYANNKSKFIHKPVQEVLPDEINKHFNEKPVTILAGCAPCQTFSQHTLKNKNRQNDSRWGLLYHFLSLVKSTKPTIVTMENVPQLRKYGVFEDFVKGLKKEGYHVSENVVYCPKYGLGQSRSRLVLLASKLGEIDLIPETHSPEEYVTVKDLIGHLKPIKHGEVSKNDPLHRSWSLSPLNFKRIKQSKQGGTWHDWDYDLRLPCHKKKSGSTFKAVYGRMKWSKLAPTMTTQFFSYGTGRYGHPTQNRAISLREGAIIQSFPEDYQFFPNYNEITFNTIGKHIGNAVPVGLGRVIGESILKHLKEVKKK